MKFQKRDNDADDKLLLEKLDKWIKAGNELVPNVNCIIKNNMFYMKCVQCLKFLPRLTKYFMVHGSKNLFTSKPGYESLHNSRTHPCRTCRSVLRKKGLSMEKGFLAGVLNNYKQLSITWFYETLAKQNGTGLITNSIMLFTTHGQNCVGIHRKNNKLDHIPENCFLEVQELNVAQFKAIPDLFDAWQSVLNI